MKKTKILFYSIFVSTFILSCAEMEAERSTPPQAVEPVVSEGLAKSSIMSDTPKIGNVTFQAKEDASSYTWTITNNSTGNIITNENNTGKEYTHNFSEAGEYVITLQTDTGISKGIITIPEEPNFAIDLAQNTTLIAINNNLYVYGINDKGQLCIDNITTPSIATPTILSSYVNVQSVGTGLNHTLFADGTTLYACGDNSEGLLGVGAGIPYSNTPISVQVGGYTGNADDTEIYIGAGDRISIVGLAVPKGAGNKMGHSFRWGWADIYGISYTPVGTMTGNASGGYALGANQFVAAGSDFAVMALTSSNSTFAMGMNDRWQNGAITKPRGSLYGGKDPDTIDMIATSEDYKNYIGFNEATQQVWAPYGGGANQGMYMTNPANSTAAAGGKFSIKKHGTEAIYVVGDNTEGQIGLEDLDSDGMVRRGAPLFVYTGTSDDTKNNMETQMSGHVEYNPIIDNISEIAAGNAHGLAISESGKLYGWGRETYGQLGSSANRTSNETNNKVYEINNPDGVEAGYKKVWAGGDRTIALAGDDNLYTWGDNRNGILGISGETAEVIDTPKKLMFDVRPAL